MFFSICVSVMELSILLRLCFFTDSSSVDVETLSVPAPAGLSKTLVTRVTGGIFLQPDQLEKVVDVKVFMLRICLKISLRVLLFPDKVVHIEVSLV